MEIRSVKIQWMIFGIVALFTKQLAGYSSSSSTTSSTYSAFALLALFIVLIAAIVLSPRGSSRLRGTILGLLVLATLVIIPFGTADSSTLYGRAATYLSNLGTIQSIYSSADQTYAYIIITAFILLVIAGAVGLFPLAAGFLGVVGMALVTVAPYAIYPHGPTTLDPGPGFYIVWIASIASLGVSFRHRRKKPSAPTSVSPVQTPEVPSGAAEGEAKVPVSQTKCPNCGTMNPADSVQCNRCGYQFIKET